MRELRERAGQIVKTICLILAVLVVYQLAGIVTRWNPFRGVTVPELPVLTAATNSLAEGAPRTNLVAATAGKGTTSVTQAKSALAGTNKTSNTTSNPAVMMAADTSPPLRKSSTNSNAPLASATTNSVTNSMPAATLAEKGTTAVTQAETAAAETNTASDTATNTTSNSTTNTPSIMAADASLPRRNSSTNPATITTTNGGTNGVAMLATNQGTNLAVSAAATGTNGAAAKANKHSPAGGPGRGLTGRHGADLPPAMQARIQQIVDCELLAPVMHPLPMALLGIAGDVAFLRSANGQTGMVKEGDSLDDLKLLRIGINRVLIEQDGQKSELMIFSGYGGDSLLPTNSTNENNHL